MSRSRGILGCGRRLSALGVLPPKGPLAGERSLVFLQVVNGAGGIAERFGSPGTSERRGDLRTVRFKVGGGARTMER